MFDPSQYHLPHINSTDDILEHVLSNFRKWHFFRHVFSRKKWLFQCHILRQHSFMSFRSQKLGSKYVIDGILKLLTHLKHPAVYAPTRHKPSHFFFKKMPFSTIFDQVLFLRGAFWGAALFGKCCPISGVNHISISASNS